MITWQTGNIKTHVAISTFKGGEVNVNINVGSVMPDAASTHRVFVKARLNSPQIQVALSHTMEALRHQYPCAKFMLEMDYVPYARQDRRCNPGESLGIKVFADYINRMQFDAVLITDPHSDVTVACIDRVYVVDQIEVFGHLHNFADWYIVAPDLGAMKKAEKFAKFFGARGVVSCMKTRNMATGEIISHTVLGATEDELSGQKFFVLDDICDGGRTFVGVYHLLNDFAPERIELAVTHGIFSYGTDVVTDLYDAVHTTNSWNPDLVSLGKLNVIPV